MPGTNRGGTERHVLEVASRLKNSFDVSIVTLEPLGSLHKDFEMAGLTISTLNPGRYSNLWSFIRLVILFRTEKEALFHFLAELYHWWDSVVSIGSKKPYVYEQKKLKRLQNSTFLLDLLRDFYIRKWTSFSKL